MRRSSLNHYYRLIWSELTRSWVAVAEFARARGKGRTARRAIAAASATALMFAIAGSSAWAAPADGQVSAGSGAIVQNGAVTTVNQTSQKLAINWQSFNIGANETVNFVQPDSSAIALNRVLGSDPSAILGKLNANGQVWLLNPNGILFDRTAQVNVGGLVATTLAISDADFLAGKRTFSGSGGSVENRGSIVAGYVALLGEQVRNEGVIVARLGTAALAAGNQVTLDFDGDRLLSVQVDAGALHALVENKGLVQADGGTVIMTAKARDALLDTVVNNTGVVRARTLENRKGRILLLGDMDSGTTKVGGTLDASAPDGGSGGFIETSAAHVKIAADAKITTKAASGKNGTWLIDPVDFTIAASGGDMTGTTLSTALSGGNITIQSSNGGSGTAGDVNVNDTVSWSANVLTLNAQNNINIRAQMNGSGTAGLALEYGQGAVAAGNTATYNVRAPVNLASTGSFSTKLGSDGSVVNYTILTRLGAQGSASGTDLQGMEGNWAGNYVLGADIDASATAGWNGGLGFQPIAGSADPSSGFSGRFDGLGHVIDRLTINRPASNSIGLFGMANSASIANIGLSRASITGINGVGGLVGSGMFLNLSNSYVTGTVSGTMFVGGLVGISRMRSTLSNVYSTASVTATFGYAGGLMGAGNLRATISNSYATGAVSGGNAVGGLVGQFSGATVSNSYFAGTVSGTTSVGALVGADYSGTAGGGYTNVYWNTDTAGSTAFGYVDSTPGARTNVAGLTTAQMRDAANWAGFNFTTTPGGSGWVLVGTNGTLNGASGTVLPMLASEWSPVIHNAHQLQLIPLDRSASYTLANDIDASATAGGAHDVWLSSSFAPVSRNTSAAYFNGRFDGQGHVIDGLTIDRPTNNYVGLFGVVDGATLANIKLTSVSIRGASGTGALAGLIENGSTVTNVSVEGGTVSGTSTVGGLVGEIIDSNSTLSHTHASVVVTGSSALGFVGGLVGDSVGGNIIDSYATGDVSGVENVGGLLGRMDRGKIYHSYALGNVTATGDQAGGLIGVVIDRFPLSFNENYASGNVRGHDYVGGLFGRVLLAANPSSYYTNSYAWGSVTGNDFVGGLIGAMLDGGATFENVYAVGRVTAANGATHVGGVLGAGFADIVGAIWDKETTGQTVGVGAGPTGGGAHGWGLTTAELKSRASTLPIWGDYQFSRLSTTGAAPSVWRLYEGLAYPLLTYFMTPLAVTVNGQSATYNGSTQNASSTYTVAGAYDPALILGSATAATGSGRNAGTYALTVDGLYSTQQGYNLTVTGGNFTIDKANLTLGTAAVTKTYDGTTAATGAAAIAMGGTQLFGSDSLSGGSFAFTDKNAGSNKTVTVGGVTVNDGNGGNNYTVTYANNTVSTIDKATLTITGTTAGDKTYDGTTSATIAAGTLSGLVGSETLGLSAAGIFDSKNAGNRSATAHYTLADGGNGGLAANYILADTTGLGATIAKAGLSIGIADVTKTYDGNTAAIGAVAIATGGTQLFGSDSLSGGSFAFTDKNAGSNKTVTVGGVTLNDGNGGNNYNVTYANNTASTIDKANLILGTAAVTKTYDGTTAATGAAAIATGGTQLFGSDSLSGGSFAFTDKKAGSNKTVTVGGVTVNDGNGGNNYTAAYANNTRSTINKAPLTVTGTFEAADKVYDGNANATITNQTLAFSGTIGGDAVTAAWGATFVDAYPGQNKSVTLAATIFGGADGSNYAIDLPRAPTATAAIKGGEPVVPGAPRHGYSGAVTSVTAGMAGSPGSNGTPGGPDASGTATPNGNSATGTPNVVLALSRGFDMGLSNLFIESCGLLLPPAIANDCK